MKISTLCKIGCIGLASAGLTCLIVATDPRFLRQMDSPHGSGGGGGMVEDLFPTPSRSPGTKSGEEKEGEKPELEPEQKETAPDTPVPADR